MTDAAELAGSRPTAPEPSEAAALKLHDQLLNLIGEALPETQVQSTLRSRIRYLLEEITRLRAGPPPAGDPIVAALEFGLHWVESWAQNPKEMEFVHLARAALRGGSHQPEETMDDDMWREVARDGHGFVRTQEEWDTLAEGFRDLAAAVESHFAGGPMPENMAAALRSAGK